MLSVTFFLPVKCKICYISLGQVQVSDVGAETEDLAHLKKENSSDLTPSKLPGIVCLQC